jgi:hypothetical protein
MNATDIASQTPTLMVAAVAAVAVLIVGTLLWKVLKMALKMVAIVVIGALAVGGVLAWKAGFIGASSVVSPASSTGDSHAR